jgi:N-acyl-D-aspartate/D-glutamate deacylase
VYDLMLATGHVDVGSGAFRRTDIGVSDGRNAFVGTVTRRTASSA